MSLKFKSRVSVIGRSIYMKVGTESTIVSFTFSMRKKERKKATQELTFVFEDINK